MKLSAIIFIIEIYYINNIVLNSFIIKVIMNINIFHLFVRYKVIYNYNCTLIIRK